MSELIELNFDKLKEFCNAVTEDLRSLEIFTEKLSAEIEELKKAAALPTKPKLELRRKLTLPVNAQGGFTGDALEIPYSKLAAGYSDEFYKPLPNGDLELFVPANGATTDNAKYPRTEERWYLADPNAPARPDGFDTMIDMERGGYVWERERKISMYYFPQTGKCVVRQSHAVKAPPDWKTIVTASGLVYILCKLTDASTTDDGRIDLATKENAIKRTADGLAPFDLYTWFDGITLKASLNGGPVMSVTFNKTTRWYPKGDGLYNAASTDVRAIVHAG